MSDPRHKSVPPPPSSRPIPSWIAPRPARSDIRPSPFLRAGRRRATNPWLHSEPPPSARVSRSMEPPPHAESPTFDSMPPSQRPPPPSMRVPPKSIPAPRIANEPTAMELSLQAEIAGLKGALADAVAMAARARREVLVASVPEVVRLATAIAEQAIGDRLDREPAVVARLAREGIDALLATDEIVVAVAPDLAERMTPEVWLLSLEGRAQVVTDPALPPMRCEVRSKVARVAVDPGSRLRAILEAIDDVASEGAEAPPSEGSP